MKPMLSGKLSSLDNLFFPCYVTPKLDGIRCLILNGEAMSRSLKPIRNKHVQKCLKGLPDGLDGELMLKYKSTFNEISSAIMSEDGEPEFVYFVFDSFNIEGGYSERIIKLDQGDWLTEYTEILYPGVVTSLEQFERYEQSALERGFEGVMIRKANGPYKFGRSTESEGYLLKWKRFTDSEAEVIGFIEQCHNENPLERDNLGHAKRSSHKENLVPAGYLGSLIVRDRKTGIEFGVGSGFTEDDRKKLWSIQDSLIGKLIKYKYQPSGVKEAPRFPVFLGFRDKEDM